LFVRGARRCASIHVFVCSEFMRTFVRVKETSCALMAWQLLERERARARGAPFQTWKCAGNRATSKKNAELLPRGNRYLQTDQHVLSDHGRVLNSLKWAARSSNFNVSKQMSHKARHCSLCLFWRKKICGQVPPALRSLFLL
jgi:hypothetical protein